MERITRGKGRGKGKKGIRVLGAVLPSAWKVAAGEVAAEKESRGKREKEGRDTDRQTQTHVACWSL